MENNEFKYVVIGHSECGRRITAKIDSSLIPTTQYLKERFISLCNSNFPDVVIDCVFMECLAFSGFKYITTLVQI